MTTATISELQARRIAVGASLEDVAQAAGVRASTVSRWERGVIKAHRNQRRAWVEAIQKVERKHD